MGKIPKAFQLSETDIKHQIRDYLNAAGAFTFHLLAGMGAYKGAPDRIFVYKGVVVFLEIKSRAAYKASIRRNSSAHAYMPADFMYWRKAWTMSCR